MSEHVHEWKTRYITFDYRYDCADGMECRICHARLDQGTVESLVNEAQDVKADYDANGVAV